MKKYVIINTISLVLVLFVNYYAQAFGINGNTISKVSNEYNNLFTPASYAFSIWGFIYVALILYIVFQVRRVFFNSGSAEFVKQTGYNFAIANIGNAAWVLAWLYDYILLSVLIMCIILISLIRIILKTNMERWDAPVKIIAFTWWPVCLYSGWITVALIANVSAYLTKIGWDRMGISEVIWAIILIVVIVAINLLMITRRSMREFALVGAWGLVAIYVRQKDEISTLAITALAGAVILVGAATYQAYLNRKTNPFLKLFQGDK